MNYELLIQEQRSFFNSRTTREVSFRKASLKALYQAVKRYERALTEALRTDLGKAPFESYATETGIVLNEIRYMLKHIGRWSRPKRQRTPLFLFGSCSRTQPEPYGVVLVLSPWNYPVQLLLSPLTGALAAGNCVVLKPSPYTPQTNRVLKQLVSETFAPHHVAFVEADNRETVRLLQERFDYIFYTGSVPFGKRVMEAAARHLTPVTLELGGKSPCIVDADADIETAARRIVWGKFVNCGQTCVAPDYLYAHRSVKQRLLEALVREIERQYGTSPRHNPDYPRIIRRERFDRLVLFLKQGHIVTGGACDENDLYIAPTVIDGIRPGDRVMSEEIFGPILPVLEFDDIDTVIDYINANEKPLALYYFGKGKKRADHVLRHTSSGGACINDVVTQVGNHHLPFGGVGHSGTGAYHGKYSFDTFSHMRSVVTTSTLFDLNLKFAPYGNKLRWVRKVLR
ncbi:MAG: aldehyde dehydrogenase [Coprobacter sp.]|nr:aldehyde dehydrogenase [Coprobacter sp.]